jgi:hypothetical protein
VPSFMILDPRTAAHATARPSALVAQALAARRAAAAGGEGPARELPIRELFARDAPARPVDRAPARPQAADARTADTRGMRESGTFTAQRLAQEGEPDARTRARLPSATAAYLRTRDSHIQILPSVQALNLRV